MEFMVNMMGTDGVLDEKTLPREVRERGGKSEEKNSSSDGEEDERTVHSETGRGTEEVLTLKELEQRAIRQAIARYGDTTQGKKEAARQLGIGLATLYRKIGE